MIYGYAIVSTKGQAKDGNSLEVQEKALRDAGAMEIYTDAFTGTKTHRPELDKLLSVMVAGDTMVTTKLDRIARSVSQGSDLIQSLLNKGISVRILNMGLMDNTPTGRLIRNVMLAYPRIGTLYVMALILCVLSLISVRLLLDSGLGLGIMAMRDDPEAAEALGVNVIRNKRLVYIIAALFTSLAGSLFFLNKGTIYPESGFDIG